MYIYIYIYSVLGVTIAIPFLCYFQMLQLPMIQRFCINSKIVSEIFKILFHSGNINILSFLVPFLVNIFN